MDAKITKHVKDVIQKHANALFRNASLPFYGMNVPPIKEMVNPDLPVVKVAGKSADIVFLLVDDSYLHLAFETGHNRIGAMLASAGYDLRLIERDKRVVHSVIIFTADVKNKPAGLDYGSFKYDPTVVLMNDYDGSAVLSQLEAKLTSGTVFSELDMLNLILLPMMRHTMPREELAMRSVALCETVADDMSRIACLAATYAFAKNYLDEAQFRKLLEVIRVPDLWEIMVADAVEDAVTSNTAEIARNLLRNKISTDLVSISTGLDKPTILQLQHELDKSEAVPV